jgi:hypothetical protein
MNKKSNLFSNQSSSSRIERIKKESINSVKQTYIGGFHQKNNVDKNVVSNALSRIRATGYVVQEKVTHKNY